MLHVANLQRASYVIQTFGLSWGNAVCCTAEITQKGPSGRSHPESEGTIPWLNFVVQKFLLLLFPVARGGATLTPAVIG